MSEDDTVEKLHSQLDGCKVSLEEFRELYIKLCNEEMTHQEFIREIEE